ncbi:LOW QUALITY PROTEIN: epiplakin [Ursus arctos]|uniref:LOW QUALITY PROTEIN: epiplakin n=1 Tax=Ursus arctos TaxID=9644 RepID=UPI002548D757|nr:LOW QUALITY PROTEIN: epiplakin [Ursus arctos]
MEVKVGRLRGPAVPVWDVLASGYVSGATREQLLAGFGSGTLGLPALTPQADHHHRGGGGGRRDRGEGGGAEGGDEGGAEPAAAGGPQEQALRAATMEVHAGQFRGQRPSVWEVLFSSYLSRARRDELLAQHAAGALAVPALVAVLTRAIEEAEERLSKVSFRGLRRQVSASELHTSGILGPETLRDLAQGTKTLQEVTEMDSVKRYLQGTSCIAGVLVPAKDEPGRQEKMSIYQAMWKGVLRPGTALVLLEAQAATGFVIDPVRNQRLSVEEAVAAGVVGGEIQEKLLSAERAVTGYTDPYTGEQISLFQAMKKDLIVRDHGIRLLEAQIATGGIIDPVHSHRVPVDVAYQRGYFDEEMSRVLADPSDDTKGFFDPNTHENLTYVQLLRRCVLDPETGLYMLQLAGRGSAVHQLSEELRGALREARVAPGPGVLQGQSVSVWELLFYREVPEGLRQDLLGRYRAGALTVQEVGAALTSQLARADDGSPRPAPPDPRGALRAATMEVKVGRLRGPAVPVWDVLASGYVSGATREQLLAGFGSGTLGLPALTRRLTTIIEEAEAAGGTERVQRGAARGPQEARPAGRGGSDGDAGPSPGQAEGQAEGGGEGGDEGGAEPAAAGGPQEQALRAATMEVHAGQFRGQRPSVWEVLFSSYLSRARRDELLAQHAAGALAVPALVAVLTRAIEEAEERLSKVSFRGLRRQVSASELHTSGILGPETLRDLAQGTKTLQEVTEMDSVKRYLQGTSCIAGVLVPAKDEPGRQEKMSIYQAMWKGVLRPGTALVLLEAQAATGFVIDPVRNQRLSVEEAVAAGVVGGEIQEKLLSAERAVTGYTDPYTGEQISLFQAMKKDLIVRDHGIRLLEAQIATGGIIDPVHSHRVPVDVAYQRGYFDEEMSRVLADPSDDTKGFFDPNTHENLTYVQLLRRCVLDPETGLYMLQLAGRGSAVHQLSEELRGALREARVAPGPGVLQGQSVSVWELLFYREVPEGLRQDLLGRYRAGALTVQEVGAALTSQLARADDGSPRPAPPDPRGALRAATMEVKVGRLRGPAVPVWDVLASGYVSGATREQLLAGFGSGTLGLPALTRRLTTIIEEAEAAGGTEPRVGARARARARAGARAGDEGEGGGEGGDEGGAEPAAAGGPQEQALRAATMEVHAGQFRGQRPSVWEVLFSSYLSRARRDELLAQHAAGALAVPALVAVLTRAIEEAEERLSKVSFRGLRRQVSASELHTSGILGPETLRDLAQGTKTLQEVTEMDSVKRYLQGTSCIAGVLVPAKDEPGRQEKMSIYQAMWKGVLRPGTALVLLEAQAATGFVIDPVRNQRLSVEEAVAAGVVGGEIQEKLLSAERAVTGYTDPYTGEQISLFQAMKKDLIVRDHGIRLLEAQIATGGIIDPVHSHRVPVDVAYQRGYFDEEMSRVLADPSDDTKGFFDPNTHENLTYVQLLRRCVLDPETGLYMLQLAGRGSAVHQLSEELRGALREARVAPGPGVLQGQSVSVWELLFYREVPEGLRQDLLGRYRAGALTVQEVGAALTSQLARADDGSPRPAPPDPRGALRAATMEVKVGRLRGPAVPVWDVLASGYVSGATREQLLAGFGSGTLGLPALTRRLTTIIEEAEAAGGTERVQRGAARGPQEGEGEGGGEGGDEGGAEPAAAGGPQEQALRAATMEVHAGQFRGQRPSVWEVLFSSYLSRARRDELLAQHAAGALAVPALVAVLTRAIEEAEERLSKVSFRGLRRQVSASELHTSGILGPETLRDLAQGTKTLQEVTEMDSVKRYLQGTSCIAGVLVPAKDEPGRQEKMSIYQAMWKGVLRPGTALVLLEAQAATGFVIDPVRNQRLSVEEAVAAGVVGGEIQEKLLSAERAVTGYTDPYTGEQISLFQAMKKDLIVRDHGIRLLEAQIATGGIIDPVHSHRVPVDVAYQRGYFDEEMSRVLADPSDDTKGFFDPNTHENLTYVQLLRRCVLDPETGLYMLQLAGRGSAVHQLSEELRGALREARVAPGPGVLQGQSVSVWELLFYREVPEGLRQDLLGRYRAGALTVQEVGAALTSQLARADDGSPRPAPPDPRGALRAATMEVKVGRLRGPAVPVWDVLASGYVSGATREQLLAGFGSGTLGLPALTRRLTTIIEEAEAAGGTERVQRGAARGPQEGEGEGGGEGGDEGGAEPAAAGGPQEQALRAATMEVHAGQFRGQRPSVWEVLFSSYLSRARRDELLAQHAAGALAVPALVAVLTRAIEEAEERLSKVSFRGLRRQVSASELHTSGILGPETLRDLAQGTKTLQEVTEMDSVKRYLQGTSCIAGVLVPAKDEPGRQEKMSIYQAMWKGVLRPGTALVLLEAQAATGFVIDPVRNQRLSVEEAVAAGVVGGEIQEKLLSAERAVTGYTDPYTGEQISLFQAMKKDLIVRDHGIRLLEAQIATGGIIDPVHSHRVPVDVAYQRGYFDEEMSRVLADPSDDTKGFFDPNTHENLTYVQLLRRCVLDPETGLYMLQLAGRGSAVHQLSEELRGALREARVAPGPGVLQGQSVSVWELLFYREVPEGLRQDLLGRYRAGALTVQEVGAALTSQLARADDGSPRPAPPDPRGALRAATMEVKVGRLRGPAVPVWDVLASGYVSGATREQLLAGFGSGTLGLPALTRRLTTIIEEAEAAGGTERVQRGAARGPQEARPAGRGGSDGDAGPSPGQAEGQAEGGGEGEGEGEGGGEGGDEGGAEPAAAGGPQEQALRAATMEVHAGQFRGQRPSVWEVLFSSYLSRARRDELLAQHAAGALAVPALVAVLTRAIEEAEERLSKVSFRGLRRQVSASELHTSGILGPETLRDLAQGTKTLQEVTEMDSVKRYLQGTSCIAGVLVPAKDEPGRQEKMSIYQAMWKGVLRPGTALVLLEAQAATGFVIDPVRNQRLSVEEAVAAGVVGGEIQEKLLSAERAVTGYTDPYTGEQISLFQAMKKDLIVRDHGIRLLEAQIATGGIIDPVHSHRVPVDVAYQRGYFDEEMSRVLADPSDDTKGFFDPNTHENLTYVQLLRRCVLDPETGLYMLQLAGRGSAVHQLSEELRGALREARVAPGPGVLQGQSVSVWELLFYREVPEGLRQDLLGRYRAGALTVQEVGAALTSQLARADDGSPRPAPPDPRGALRAATMEVKVGRLRGPAVPVWDVLASGYVSGATREQLLAGFGSGTLGLPALTRRLTTIIEEAEAAGGTERVQRGAARGPQEARPAGRGGSDGDAGPSPGQAEGQAEGGGEGEGEGEGGGEGGDEGEGGGEGGDEGGAEPAAAGGPQEQALRAATMEVHAGQFRGQRPSVWEVLFSSYLSRARRDELLAQHAAGALAVPALVAVLTRAIEEAEERLSKVSFRGLRRQVSASELHTSGILGPETLRDLAQGTKTLQEVTEMDSVKRYLQGTSCIAGVLVPAKDEPGRQEKMSIYQAMWKGVLRPGTALVLLEAQAATGFVIDPVRNQRLSVEEAVAAGVVGGEIQEKLLSAERAVTGYTDPYTGEQISLFQAMKKDLIVRDHGIRLLEAQIATGGIIDPVHSHRVPVDVAYQRGYFDEEMSRVLADPSDDTKGFFDPNTHENLTYVQLLRRCVLDPETGLYMLQLAGRGSAVHQLSEELRGALREARVAPGPGVLQGQSVSVWELLFYREVPEGLRQDLLGRYRAGALTVQEVGAALTSQLARADDGSPRPAPPDPRGALRAATMEVKVGRLRGPAVPVWDVLASGYVSGATREQLLAGFGSGTLGLPALTRRLTTIIEEAEAAGGTERVQRGAARGPQEARPAGRGGSDGDAGPSPGQAEGQAEGGGEGEGEGEGGGEGGDEGGAEPAAAGGPQEQALRAATMEVHAGQFRGQRPSVWEVLFSSYLSRARRDELLAQHAAGALAVPALVAVLTRAIEEAEERLSKVSFRGLRRQVSASELHTSGILGPETLRDLAQGTKTLQEVTEMDSVKRYLQGTSCIAGVLVPAKDEPGRQEKMSIYQAMWKGVLRPGTALVLLEAQAATGFVIDPVRNQRLSVEEAVAAGVVGGEIQEKLLSAERAVTGYTDPYTGEQISLFQAMKKDLIVRDHGIRLLEAQIATGGIIDPVHSHRVPVDVAYQRGYFDEEMSRVLADPSDDTKGFFDPNTHENLTYVQLLRRCVLDPETGLYMLQLAGRGSAVHQLSEELRGALREARVAPGPGVLQGQSVSVWELLFYREVPEGLRQDLLGRYRAGALTVQEVGAALTSQLARADDGSPRPAPPDPRGALRAATMEVKVGRLRGPAVPVWDVLASGYVSGATREQLLAGFGSGTLGLPALTRRLTTIIEEAEAAGGTERVQRGAARGPQEARPAGRGGSDGDAGPSPGQAEGQAEGGGEGEGEGEGGGEGGDEGGAEPAAAGGPQEQALRAATMEVHAGQFRGQRPSVWEVLFSSYLSRARRDELLAQHAAGALAVPALVAVLTRAIEEAEERLSKVSFRGLRRQVSASELHTSGILGPETLRDLAQGTKTLQEVTEMDSVKRYLQGTSCIAGVLVPAKDEPGRQEKMSIYQAMWKGVLRPGTALVLLEAQAATGFVIDPVRNQRLSVEEAVAAGVVGGEIQEKLLSAERAVTGYTDPYTGEQISLFQAMKKDLIVRDHGIRLLEAQIATGGIIDPVHSHRVPVDVAYQRGYFDEEMSRVLADPSDDTKGFFDPNTHENLTYVQLLRRCVLDPETGLYMLQLAGRGSAVHQLSEELRGALREARVAPGPGVLQGQSVSVWELLFYREVPEGLRQDLLGRYRAGALTVQEVGAALTSQLARADDGSPRPAPPDPRGALRAATMEVKVGRLRGPAVPVWDVLASGYVSGATREQLLAGFGSGTLGLPALTRRLTTIIEEAEAAGGTERVQRGAARGPQEARPAGRGGSDGDAGPSPGQAEGQAEGGGEGEGEGEGGGEGGDEGGAEPAAAGGPQEQALRAATMEVHAGQFRGQRPSVWEVLFSSYLSRARRDELLAQHAAGALAVPALVAVLTRAIEEAEERLSKVSFRGLRRQVSASELHTSGILGPETLRDLAQGTKTLQEVTEMDSVKRYLQGTSCIAGVLVPAKDEPGRQEKMSIYQAMWKGVLRPGTALVLLEAQAATGFVIDPVRNQRLSVEEAVAAGVVGGEIQEKLLSAERAVTGYTDPYTGEQISLFQAMKKDLIVRDHGIRLLEAQIATGGIIDPVHSHRVPVDVAYQRGYFDEEMSRVLADPSDDTKGFFDPNTHENLTYMELLQRATVDPETGLLLLPVN